MNASPWLFTILGEAILLGVFLADGQIRSSRRDKQLEPDTSGDAPSKGAHRT